jgi:DNA-binding CsgD family transcriptional regulator
LVTDGNPFFVHQLVDELVAQGLRGTAAEARRVHELGPRTVAAAVLLRLSRLPEAALALARAVAILGEQSEYRHVLRLAELDETGGVDAIASLATSGVIEDTRPLRFVHPIVRNAIYLDLSVTERSRAHRRAAALLLAECAPSELVATQLLLSDPNGDPEVVDALRGAAAEALTRGAPDAAARWLSRALAEPPDEPVRGHVMFELGRAEALAHDPSAIEHLEAAVEACEEPRAQAQAARLLARLLTLAARWPEAVALLDREVRSMERVDPELALALANDRAFVTRHTPAPIEDRRKGVEEVRRLLGPAIAHPRTPAERAAVINLAVDETSLCQPAGKVVEMVELALSGDLLLREETSDSPLFIVAAEILLYADQLDAAYEQFTAGLEDARARGSVSGFVMSCCFRAHTAFRQGRVLAAETDARASLETEDTVLPHFLPTQLAALIDALMSRDQLQAAANELARHRLDGALTDEYHAAFLLDSRARLRLAQGRADDALADALDAGRRQNAAQTPNPTMVPWGSTAALAAAATGDLQRAQELAEEELELARAFGAPRAVGIALRARALVSSRADERIERLREAVNVLEHSPARLDHAVALVDLGAALRRDQQRVNARDPLRKGLDIATTAGSVALANRAREELAATGAKLRRTRVTGVTALTPSEQRIARMAADGKTNNQIAQSLFLTPRTVEMHLTAAYRKLSITSRTQLQSALQAEHPHAISSN